VGLENHRVVGDQFDEARAPVVAENVADGISLNGFGQAVGDDGLGCVTQQVPAGEPA
tara:strand:- start:19196 stop:19366 length:171 start_codon:yes stop_codon:yes gene_type:complete